MADGSPTPRNNPSANVRSQKVLREDPVSASIHVIASEECHILPPRPTETNTSFPKAVLYGEDNAPGSRAIQFEPFVETRTRARAFPAESGTKGGSVPTTTNIPL